MKKEQYELIMLDFWEDYGLPEGYAAETSSDPDHDNSYGDAGGWET